MKYYYNGQLIRSSKNEYRFGLVRNGKIIKCSATTKALESEIVRITKLAYGKDGNIEWMKREGYPENEIEECKARTDADVSSLRIVELEARP